MNWVATTMMVLTVVTTMLMAPHCAGSVVSGSALLTPDGVECRDGRYGGVLGGLDEYAMETDEWERVVDMAYWGILRRGLNAQCGEPDLFRLLNASAVTVQTLTHTRDGKNPNIIQVMDYTGRPRWWQVTLGWTYSLSLQILHPFSSSTSSSSTSSEGGVLFLHTATLTTDVYRRPATLTSHTFSPTHPPSTPPPTPSSTLRVTAYNIWNTNRWNDRVHELADRIRKEDADVVGLQEVRIDVTLRDKPEFGFDPDSVLGRMELDGMDAVNQMAHLAMLLPEYPYYVFRPAMTYPILPVGRVEEGLAFFSKTPLEDVSVTLLSRDPTQGHMDVHQRILLSAFTQGWHGGGRINVLQTHASLTPTARLRNILEVSLQTQALAKRHSPQAQILMGDFNTCVADKRTGYGQSIEFITGRRKLNSAFAPAVFADAWYDDPDPSDPLGFTFPAHNVSLRIDLLLYRGPNVSSRGMRAISGYAIYNPLDPDSNLLISDHKGVTADFVLPNDDV